MNTTKLLSHTEFYETKFVDCSADELIGAAFDNCQFINCNLNGAEISKSTFIDSEFINCELSNSILKEANFNDVAFRNCKMLGIDWTKAKWPFIALSTPLFFYHCDLSYNNFFDLSLAGLILQGCIATEADFRGADLSGADLSGSDFEKAEFLKTNLKDAIFTNAENYIINPSENEVKGAVFSSPDVCGLLLHLGIKIEGFTS